MGNFLWVLFCFSFLLLTAPSLPLLAADCSEGCLEATDCSGSCKVCTGTCVDCSDLGDQASCEDTGTGASTNCTWSGGACSSAGGVPGFPSQAVFFFFSFLFFPIVFSRWNKKLPS